MKDISNTIKDLIIKEPFYGLLAINLDRLYSDKTEDLTIQYSENRVKLLINKGYFKALDMPQRRNAVKHELLHMVFKHMEDYWTKTKDDSLLNLAMDLEVISYLDENALTEKDQSVHNLFSMFNLDKKLGTKTYYEFLKKLKGNSPDDPNGKAQNGPQENTLNDYKDGPSGDSDQNNSSGDNQGNDSPQGNPLPSPKHDFCDEDFKNDLDKSTSSPKETEAIISKLISNNTKNTIENIAQEAKQRGTLPDEAINYLKNNIKAHTEVPWNIHLRRIIKTAASVTRKKGKRRESERFEGFYKNTNKKIIDVLVAIDTSGSIDEVLLEKFISELRGLYNSIDVNMEVIQCDAKIHIRETFTKQYKINKIYGRGGTSFMPVVEAFKDSNANALIYYTDGYGDQSKFSDKMIRYLTPRCLWVLPTNGLKENLPGKVITIKL